MPKIMQTEESKLIEAIRDVLMAADAVRCDIDSYEPEVYVNNALYHIPAGYCATAIHEAGYRKEKTHDPD